MKGGLSTEGSQYDSRGESTVVYKTPAREGTPDHNGENILIYLGQKNTP